MTEQDVRETIATIVRRYEGHFCPLIKRREVPLKPPTAEHWQALKTKFGCGFPSSFVHFMNIMAEYDIPGHLDVPPGDPHDGECIASRYDIEVSYGGWDEDLIPFHAVGNGDFHCLSAAAGCESPVFYVYHDVIIEEATEQIAASFEEWMQRLEFFLRGELDSIAEKDVARLAPFDETARQQLAAAFLEAAMKIEEGTSKDTTPS